MTEAEARVIDAAVKKAEEHEAQHGPRQSPYTGCYCTLCMAVAKLNDERK